MPVTEEQDYFEATLTAANLTEDFRNTSGCLEISGAFDGGTVTQTVIGGTVAIDTFSAAEAIFTNASSLTFTIAGGGGSESVVVRWYKDRNRVSRF